MKCALNIDFDKKLIIMTRLFSQRCRDTSSKEYHSRSVNSRRWPLFLSLLVCYNTEKQAVGRRRT